MCTSRQKYREDLLGLVESTWGVSYMTAWRYLHDLTSERPPRLIVRYGRFLPAGSEPLEVLP